MLSQQLPGRTKENQNNSGTSVCKPTFETGIFQKQSGVVIIRPRSSMTRYLKEYASTYKLAQR
jgi:hypothetical protein